MTEKTTDQGKENRKMPERMFYVKLPSAFEENPRISYLNLRVGANSFFFDSRHDDDEYKTKFTNDELDHIQKQLPFLNIGLLKVPVEDD